MREIKFRGKRVDNGEWAYGFLLITVNGVVYILDAHNGIIKPFQEEQPVFSGNHYEVLPETVGQYTGLKDRKRTEEYPEGQDIYEGDIVRCEDWINDAHAYNTWKREVIWAKTAGMWIGMNGEFNEVIGNIHETKG